MLKMQIRPLTIFVAVLTVVVLNYFSPPTVDANHSNLKMPFQSGPTWKISSGYHDTFAHEGYKLYSLDLVRDDHQTTGQNVVAGSGGTVAWIDATYGCVSIDLQDNYYLMTCHMLGAGSFSSGQSISQGQVLGTVAPAGQAGNNGTPHIHITLYYATYSAAPPNARTAIPFDSAHGSKLDGYDFPPNGTVNQYAGTTGLQSTNGGGGGGSDNAAFVADVTVPDGTTFSPGQSFTKTWRMRNTGTTTWGSGYSFAFVSGDQMNAPSSVSVSSTSPNNTTDISVNMTAPGSAGSYKGYWRMRNAQGNFFGDTVWVQINVSAPSCPSVSDGVHLWDSTDCSGSSVGPLRPGNYDFSSSFNDRAKSLAVPSGWSIRLYKDNSWSSPNVCVSSTTSDLHSYNYSDGSTAWGSMTWAIVHNQSNCPLPIPTNNYLYLPFIRK